MAILSFCFPLKTFASSADSTIALPQVPVTNIKAKITDNYAFELPLKDSLPSRFDDFSMDKYMNTIPGVKWGTHEGGSTTISIRGSGLSSQFGVRDLKIYMDDVPLTTPDGFTAIEFTDPFLLTGVEVFRGPAGTSIFGAENGGTIIFKQDTTAIHGITATGGLTIGDFGTVRGIAGIKYGSDKGYISLSAVSQNTNGYRQQEFVYRDLLNLNAHYTLGKNSFTLWAAYNFGEWGLPGSLTLQNALENPRQALPYSLSADAYLKKEAAKGGFTFRNDIREGLIFKITLFADGSNKYNPFGTAPSNNGVKFEKQGGPGLRMQLEQDVSLKKVIITNHYGVEYQTEFDHLNNYVNTGNAVLGAPIENSNTRLDQLIIFAQSNLHFITGTIISAGLSFDNNDLKYANAVVVNGVYEKYRHWYTPAILPSLALTQKYAVQQSVFASGSAGVSAPQLLETVNTDGSLNRNLQNETSWNVEGGFKGAVRKIYFDYTVDVFCQWYRGLILPYSPAGNDLVYYQNSGNTRNLGFEGSAGFHIPFTGYASKVLSMLAVTGNYAYSYFRFQQFSSAGIDYRGERVPGVPDNAGNIQASIQSAIGIYFTGTFSLYSAIPLNNANTDLAPAYHTFDLKAGYFIYRKNIEADVFLGIDNVLNSTYYSFLQLNAVGGKYFNPAPARYIYAGFKISFTEINKQGIRFN